jgi:thiamine-monophosphate kinase
MEIEFIRWLREQLPSHPELVVGVGDDAAVLRSAAGGDIVLTTDLLADGVHFQLGECGPERAGRKAMAVNLSDLAAMAARPVAAVVSLALPREGADCLARGLCRGLLEMATRYDVAIAGGDTNTWQGALVVSVTALGQLTARGPLRRAGAQPGDQILVTGSFGGSILGRHLDFLPRVTEALWLHEHYELHAGIDVSDGLSLDLSRLAAESGCGAALNLDQIPVDPAAFVLAAADPAGATPLEHALHDGEDFELLLAAPPDAARAILADQPLNVRVARIGEMVPQSGLWRANRAGELKPLAARGYEHR